MLTPRMDASPESVNPLHLQSVTYRCQPRGITREMTGGPAERIRALLKERGWSQRDLARHAGFKSPSQVGNILANLDADPGAIEKKTAERIAAGLGVSASSIFFDDAPAALTIDRTHADEPPPPSRAAALQRALWDKAKELNSEPEDYDAARAVGVESAQYLEADGDVLGFAESLLRAAASLRRDAKPVNTASILARVHAGRTYGAEARAAAPSEAVERESDELGEATGAVRGAKKHLGEKMGAAIAKQRAKGAG